MGERSRTRQSIPRRSFGDNPVTVVILLDGGDRSEHQMTKSRTQSRMIGNNDRKEVGVSAKKKGSGKNRWDGNRCRNVRRSK